MNDAAAAEFGAVNRKRAKLSAQQKRRSQNYSMSSLHFFQRDKNVKTMSVYTENMWSGAVVTSTWLGLARCYNQATFSPLDFFCAG